MSDDGYGLSNSDVDDLGRLTRETIVWAVACPTCGAERGQRCEGTETDDSGVDVHDARARRYRRSQP